MAPASRTDRSAAAAPPLTFTRWLLGVLRRGRLAAAVGVVVAGLFVAAALVLPPVYRAEASFVSNTGTGLKLPAGLGAMAGLAGMASEAGMNLGAEPSETPAFYVQLIHSRELLTRLLDSRFADPEGSSAADSARLVDILDLGDDPEARRVELGVKRLRKGVVLTSDRSTNLVTLQVDMPDAALSAGVANRIVELVDQFNREQRTTRARAKRAFVEGRLADAERALRTAEDQHRLFLAQNRQYSRSPTLAAEERRLERRMNAAVDIASALRREYESARIDEINDAPVITHVDSAVPPQKPRWPQPLPLAVLALVAAAVCGVLAAGLATLLSEWSRRHQEESAELRRILRRRARPDREPAPARATTGGDGVPLTAPAANGANGAGAPHASTIDVG